MQLDAMAAALGVAQTCEEAAAAERALAEDYAVRHGIAWYEWLGRPVPAVRS